MTENYLGAQQIADLLGQPRPTDEQRRVIEAPLESMLVIAGAGSGKTETMSARVVWLIANGMVAPEQVLGLTFTRKAAGELAERVRLRLSQLTAARASGADPVRGSTSLDVLSALDRPTISTYNSYAASLVSNHGLRIGREPGARMLSEATQWGIAAEIVERWNSDIDSENAVSTIVEAVLKLAGALNEHLLSVEEAKIQLSALVEPLIEIPISGRSLKADVGKLGNTLSVRVQLMDLVAEYQDRKRQLETMDFGDQVALAAELAMTAPQVGDLERERFKVVLLDEYQDTSYAQIQLLTALFGAGHPVTAVGDPNQSIYGWRGASASGLARFPEQFKNPDGRRAKTYQLGTSWRNDTQILDVANFTARPLFENDPANSLPSLSPRPGARRGEVHAGYFLTVEEEAEQAAQFLTKHWKPGVSTAAILCRARSQFPILEAALRTRSIPVEVVGLGGLLLTPEVVDLVALLEVVHDPSRGDALMRLLTGPRFNLGPADLVALNNLARIKARRRPASAAANLEHSEAPNLLGQQTGPNGEYGSGSDETAEPTIEPDSSDDRSIIDALNDLPKPEWSDQKGFTAAGLRRLRKLGSVLQSLRALTYLPIVELVEQGERILGLDIEMSLIADRSARRGTPPDPANPWGRAHLDAFKRVAGEFGDSATTPTLGGFLAWLDDAQRRERGLEKPLGTPDPNAVQLITIHASKGLEWDVVVVPGLINGVFPNTATTPEKGPTDSGWLTALGELPFPLRGDARDLPQLDYLQATDDGEVLELMNQFKQECGEHMVFEERRLAYVAFTRARSKLLLSGSWWREAKKPTVPSPFLSEPVEQGVITNYTITPAPEPGAENPRAGHEDIAMWPDELAELPANAHLDAQTQMVNQEMAHTLAVIAQSGQQVAEELEKLHSSVMGSANTVASLPTGEIRSAAGSDLVQLARLLLAERERAGQVSSDVAFPQHISVSGLVEISRDRQGYALAQRRPIPQQPSVASRRGTTFHLWVKQFYGTTTLFDVDDLPGTDDFYIESDEQLEKMQKTFESSPWAKLSPIELEADIDVVIAGTVIRSRIDAVFPDPEADPKTGGVVVVDWKTGRAPTNEVEKSNRELQLAVYRLAWSQWSGTPLEHVSAAFYYVASNTTVRPEHLATAQEIEDLMLG